MSTELEFASATDLMTAPAQVEMRDVCLSSGKVVTVRGLTRRELLTSGHGTEDTSVMECRNVAAAMIRPSMSEAQVREWQKVSGPKDLGLVTAAIRDLSGLGQGAEKSGVSGVRD